MLHINTAPTNIHFIWGFETALIVIKLRYFPDLCARFSGPADKGSVLQGWWPARPLDQRAAGDTAVPAAVPEAGPGGLEARRGKHNQLLQCRLQGRYQRRRNNIHSKFSRRSREHPRLCSVWTQRLEGNNRLIDWCWTHTAEKHCVKRNAFLKKNSSSTFLICLHGRETMARLHCHYKTLISQWDVF